MDGSSGAKRYSKFTNITFSYKQQDVVENYDLLIKGHGTKKKKRIYL